MPEDAAEVTSDVAAVADLVGSDIPTGEETTPAPKAAPKAKASPPKESAEATGTAPGADDDAPVDPRVVGAAAHKLSADRQQTRAREEFARREDTRRRQEHKEYMAATVAAINQRAPAAAPQAPPKPSSLLDDPEGRKPSDVYAADQLATSAQIAAVNQRLDEQDRQRAYDQQQQQAAYDQQQQQAAYDQQNLSEINRDVDEWESASPETAGFKGSGGIMEQWAERHSANLRAQYPRATADQIRGALLTSINGFKAEGARTGTAWPLLLEYHATAIGVGADAPAAAPAAPAPAAGLSTSQAALAAHAAGQTGSIGAAAAAAPVTPNGNSQVRSVADLKADGVTPLQYANMLVANADGNVDAMKASLMATIDLGDPI